MCIYNVGRHLAEAMQLAANCLRRILLDCLIQKNELAQKNRFAVTIVQKENVTLLVFTLFVTVHWNMLNAARATVRLDEFDSKIFVGRLGKEAENVGIVLDGVLDPRNLLGG